MLRIFFTSDDIARTRLATGPDPLWETVLSVHILRTQRADHLHGEWRQRVSTELRLSGLVPSLRTLFVLNPATGYFPDFLTPFEGIDGVEAGLAAVAATPARLLRRDLAILAEDRPLSAEIGDLADGHPSAIRQLTHAMRVYYDLALAPEWSRVEAAVESDRARRIRAVAASGAEGLLASLRPGMRWGAGELQVNYPFDQEMHLDGRGLLLVPSYFCWGDPVTLLDPELPPILVYPAERPLAKSARADESHHALAALLGATRAAALAAIGNGCSTTDLARRVGVSPAAASQHATVLRNAGLISSQREGSTMLHSVTPLGTSVLNGH
jgi:DNA-binding transcriptional ArsR family regulator